MIQIFKECLMQQHFDTFMANSPILCRWYAPSRLYVPRNNRQTLINYKRYAKMYTTLCHVHVVYIICMVGPPYMYLPKVATVHIKYVRRYCRMYAAYSIPLSDRRNDTKVMYHVCVQFHI